MAYHHNAYVKARDTLAEAGLDTTPLTQRNQVFKAGSGRLVHFERRCGRIRDPFAAKTKLVDVTQLDSAQLCSTCCRSISDPAVRTYLDAAGSLITVRADVDSIRQAVAAQPSWQQVLRFERAIDVLAELLDNEHAHPLHAQVRSLLEELRVEVRRVQELAGSTDEVRWRCAATFLNEKEQPAGFNIEVFGSGSSWGSGQRMLEALLAAFQSHSAAGESYAAVKTRAVQMGEQPKEFSQVPADRQLDVRCFGRLDDYAAAEWRLARDQQAHLLATHWVQQVRRILEEHADRPDQIVLLTNYKAQGTVEQLGPQLGPFGLHRCTAQPSTVLVRLPSVVAAWLKDGLPTAATSNTPELHSVDALDDDTDAVLQVAASLYDPGDDQMGGQGAVAAARLVCRTNHQ